MIRISRQAWRLQAVLPQIEPGLGVSGDGQADQVGHRPTANDQPARIGREPQQFGHPAHHLTLDLLGESGKILKVPGNGEAELWRYISLRVPVLISRFLPFSVLLGTLIAFVGLNQHSEVVAMKAAGLSAHQILAPMIVASVYTGGP